MTHIVNKHIMVFGVPRTATTWVSEVLAADGQLTLVHEPDNAVRSFLGLILKAGLPRFPYLKQEDRHAHYERLFHLALTKTISPLGSTENKFFFCLYNKQFSTLQRNLEHHGTALPGTIPFSRLPLAILVRNDGNKRKLIKSVHAILAIPFLLAHFDIQPIVIFRHPLDVYSSYVRWNMADQDRAIYNNSALLEDYHIPGIDPGAKNSSFKAGYQVGVFYKVLGSTIKAHPKIIELHYEHILADPYHHFEELFGALSLSYGPKIEHFISSRFKPGKGYETFRDPKKQVDIYKTRLSGEQIEGFLQGYETATGAIDFLT